MPRRWTDEDIGTLRRLARTKTRSEIAAHFGVSESALYKRAQERGIRLAAKPSPAATQTVRELARRGWRESRIAHHVGVDVAAVRAVLATPAV